MKNKGQIRNPTQEGVFPLCFYYIIGVSGVPMGVPVKKGCFSQVPRAATRKISANLWHEMLLFMLSGHFYPYTCVYIHI